MRAVRAPQHMSLWPQHDAFQKLSSARRGLDVQFDEICQRRWSNITEYRVRCEPEMAMKVVRSVQTSLCDVTSMCVAVHFSRSPEEGLKCPLHPSPINMMSVGETCDVSHVHQVKCSRMAKHCWIWLWSSDPVSSQYSAQALKSQARQGDNVDMYKCPPKTGKRHP